MNNPFEDFDDGIAEFADSYYDYIVVPINKPVIFEDEDPDLPF